VLTKGAIFFLKFYEQYNKIKKSLNIGPTIYNFQKVITGGCWRRTKINITIFFVNLRN
jgi:hypothetical protein